MVETKLEFRKIELSDKPWIESLLKKSDFRGSEYCFGNNFIWANAYSSRPFRPARAVSPRWSG